MSTWLLGSNSSDASPPGIPVSIYADRHAIFLSQNAGKLSIEDQLAGKFVNDTQFGRAMSELGVTLIAARSPQAKGRVERLWETLQSRLPVEFAIAQISTVDQANAFLASYIDDFNQHFSVEPINSDPAFRVLSNIDVDTVLCVKMKRVVDAGSVFSFYNRHFVLTTANKALLPPPKATVTVLISPRLGLKAQYRNTVFEILPYIKPAKASKSKQSGTSKEPWIPPDSHYYKYGHTLIKKVTFEDTDKDILAMLETIFLCKYA